MHTEPRTWQALMEKLSRLAIRYLNGQIAAGAQAVQLFDSWVGCLSPADYRHNVLPYMRGVIAAIEGGVPVIHFGTNTAGLLELMREAGGDVIGLDWRVDLGQAWRRLGDGVGGRRVPPARIEEVVHHYARFDGHSPLTELTQRQARALEADLASRGPAIPVYVGMRNWAPYLHETLARMRSEGVRRAVGIVMAPHRSYSSWDQYHENVAEARARVGEGAPEVAYLRPWFDHPGFIEAQADRAAAALDLVPSEERSTTHMIF